MTDLEGTDADGELSDEEVLRSGSQTGVSDQEESQQKVRMGRNVSTRVPIVSLTAKVDNSPSSYINSSSDPVSSILERIDAELDDMDRRNTQTFPSTQAHTSALRPRSSSHGKSSPDTGLGSVSFADDLELTDKDRLTNCHPQQKDQISGSAEIYSEANTTDAFTDDDASRRHDDNNPSDLDSIAAQQIDRKFKEIMRKKKVPPDLPPHPGRPLGALSSRLRSRSANRASANMLSTGTDDKKQQGTDDKDGQTSGRLGFGAGYGTDNESVKTEDFESKFMNLIVNGSDTERADTAGSAASTARNKSESRINGRSDRTRGGGACGERADKNETALKNTLTPTEDNKQENKRDDANDIIHRLRSIAQSSTPAAPTPILSRPRSVSPTRNRGEKKVVCIADSGRARREIAQESAQIQQEMERERRARSVSPSSHSMSPPPYASHRPRPSSVTRTTGNKSKSDLSGDIAAMMANTSAVFSSAEDALLAGHELKTVRQALHLTRKELREAESELKHARELTEDAKSGLMVVEFKRGNASKDLERLADDVTRKQNQLTSLNSELKTKIHEAKNMTSLGLSREDCLEIKSMKEENICLKTKVRSLEGLQLERDELLRQLEAAKEDVLREQRAFRVHRAELQEEMETLAARLEETQTGWGDGQVQMAKLEAAFRQMEREKNEIIQEQSREYDSLKATQREETADTNKRLRKEMNKLDDELQELKVRVTDLQSDNSTKETLVEQLRAQISELQSVLAKERQDRHKTSSEQKRSLQHLKKETAAAVLKLKESMFLEKQKALEDLRYEMEQERRESGARVEDKLAQALEDNSSALAEKSAEVSRLEDKVRRLEHESQLETERKIHEALNRERERSEKEKERQVRLEKEDGKRRTNELITQVDREKQTNKGLQRELADLKKELEEQRRQQRETSKEKLVAVAKAKDQMKEQSSAEIERVKFNLQQEHEREVERLSEKLRYQEDELSALRTDQQDMVVRERNALQALEHAERTVIGEINEECSRVAGILGISPRTVHQTSFHFESRDGRDSPSFKTRPVLMTALANLRACNEELHNHIAELQQEVESLKVMVETVTKEKEEAIENCKLQMEKQRTLDLEKLKDKLLKEHVEEMSQVIRQCAESNQKLAANNHQLADTNDQLVIDNKNLKHYGDIALLEALQAKDAELKSLQRSVEQWQKEAGDKFHTQLQLQMAKEREKYQALQHHSTREQKRISDLQKGEIDRLEKEVQKLAMSQSHVSDSNRQPHPSPTPVATSSPLALPTTTVATATAETTNEKTSQQLQSRIKQLQADNAALRKQRLQTSERLNMSLPNLAKPQPIRPLSPFGRPRSPTRDPEVLRRLEERFRIGEQSAIKAEERAKLSQKVMNNKIEEMAKLQHTLFSQNQELQELEKAYSDLHKQYNNRGVSPARGLNTTL